MHWKITALWGGKKVELRETQRAVTPFGGLVVFFEFLRQIGYREAVSKHLPFHLTSPNAIDPVETFTAFLLSVLAGARRFAHTSLLRADVALQALLGISRFPGDDTIRNLFKRFGQGQCQRFFSGLWGWQLTRLPECSAGYSLDLDSTVFERYGRQQGALRGPNPRKHGRLSHHPLVAVLAEAHFLLQGWLRSVNCGTARGVVEFLKEALALLPKKHAIRVVRADAGFFDQQSLDFRAAWFVLHHCDVADAVAEARDGTRQFVARPEGLAEPRAKPKDQSKPKYHVPAYNPGGNHGTGHFYLAKNIQGGKGRKDRDVMLSPMLVEELHAHWHRLRGKPSVWLFHGNHRHSSDLPIHTKTVWHACHNRCQESAHREKRPSSHASPLFCYASTRGWCRSAHHSDPVRPSRSERKLIVIH